MKTVYMPWVDELTEVGAPIRKERDAILAGLVEAEQLEKKAATLRAAMETRKAAFLVRVKTLWNAEEVKAAQEATEHLTHDVPLFCVDDEALRRDVQCLEGLASPLEVLRLYGRHVVKQHNLMTTATAAERLETLRRGLDWWNSAARLVVSRFDQPESCQ